MPPKPRLLLIAPYFFPRNYGGAPQFYDGLLRRMTHFEITVLSETGDGDPTSLAAFDRQAPSANGYRVLRLPRIVFHFTARTLPGRLWQMTRHFQLARRALLRAVNEIQPQIALCGTTFSAGWMMRALPPRIARVNMILGEELTLRRDGGRLDQWLIKNQIRAIEEAGLNLAISRYSAETLQRIARVKPEQVALLPCAVDAARFTPPADRASLRARLGWQGRSVILTVARLVARKGIDQTLRALAAQSQAGALPDDWLYCIGGNGPEKEALAKLADASGLAGRVRFLGFVPDEALPDYYGAADLFALTNRELPTGDTEGFGIVFIEANACGTAVLGGLAGGTDEAIEDGVSGLRVNGDSIEEIGQALSRLLSHSEERERLARGGLQRARDRFDMARRAREIEAILLRITGHTAQSE